MSAAISNMGDLEIINILKLNWLEKDQGTAEEEKQKITSVKDLFITYSKLRRIPKLVAKLLTVINDIASENSGNVHLNQNFLDISILHVFSQCIRSIPVGQTLEIWDLFLQAYEKCSSSLENSPLFPGALFLIARLFSTFLCHTQLFDDTFLPIIKDKIALLMNKTYKLLQETSPILERKQNINDLCKLSFLLLVQAYNEVKLVFHVFGASHFSIDLTENGTCCVFQLFPSHESLGCDHDEIYLSFFKHEDKRFGYMIFKLLIQEIKTMVIKQEISEKEKQLLKSIIKLLLDETISSTVHCIDNSWDLSVNSVDLENFGICYWNLLLGHVHLLTGFIDDKSLITLCSAMIEVLVHAKDYKRSHRGSIQSSILRFLSSSSFFAESKMFQTAFVTSVWKCCSTLFYGKRSHSESEDGRDKFDVALIFQELHSSGYRWEKYSLTTPKGMESQEVNSMWTMVKVASDILNSLLEASSTFPGKLKVTEIANLLKVFNFLPLEYLLPSNQMRCVLGLSTVFFLLQNSYTSNDSSIYQVLVDVINILLPIFEGVRSIWFFDFVHPVPYIKALISIIEKMHQSDFNRNTEVFKKLLDSVFNLSTRNLQSVLTIEAFIPELIADSRKFHSSTLAFLCLLQRVIQLLQRSYLQPQLKEVCERLAALSCSAIAKSMHHWKKDVESDVNIFTSLLTSYEALVKLVLNPKCKFDDEKRKKWLKYLKTILEMAFAKIQKSMNEEEIAPFLSFICTVSVYRTDLSLYVPNDFAVQVWKFIHSYILKKKASKNCSFMDNICKNKDWTRTSDLPVCYFCHNAIDTKKNADSPQFVANDESSSSSNVYNFPDFVKKYYFTELERKAITNAVKTSSGDEFEIIFQELSNEIGHMELDIGVLDAVDFEIKLSLIISLFNVATDEVQITSLSKVTQKCLMNLHFIVGQTCKGMGCLLKIIVPSLNFMSCILKNCKKGLPKQCVVQCLYACTAVKAKSCINQPAIFVVTYTAIWSVLHELMVNHTFSTLSSSSAFMPSVTNLMKLIIYASNQDLMSTYENEMQQEILLCAQNLDRILGLITKHKREFSKVVPYLVAEYVDVVQNVTIYPSVKAVLVMGMNRLLDICSEESLRMLAVNINHSCREIFNSLVKNYKQQCFVGQI